MTASILDDIARLFSDDGFVPRRICGRWPSWLVAEHVAGNALIWVAYLVMPILIWRLARHRPELRPFRGLAMASAFFVGLCGLGHFLDMLAFFRPMYRLSGLVLLATGLVAWWTAWATARAWPRIMAMKSPEELERLVAERTADLTRAIADLERAEVDRAYLATIVESSNDAIIAKDLDGVVTSWNGGAERLFGYPAAEAIGRRITFLIPEDRLAEEPAILARVRAGDPVPPFESVRRTKDGRTIDVSLSISPIKARDGRIVGVSKIIADITEKKRAEAALRESERRFRALIETLPQLVWSTGADGDNEYSSPQWFTYTGCADIAELKARWDEVLHPDDHARFHAVWRSSVAGGEPYDMEYRMRRFDGEHRWFKVRGVAIREPDGQIAQWFGTCTDIDDQKRAEEALRKGEERQRLALSAARMSHWEWDIPNDRILYQDSLSTLYDRPDDRPFESFAEFLSIVHPDDRDAVRLAAERAFRPDVPYEIEYRIVRRDGSIRWLASRGGTYFDDDGRPIWMVGINLDVTDRKASEAEIRRLNETLERRVEERTVELAEAYEALHDEERRFGAIFDSMFQLIGLLSPEGIILEANRAALELGGHGRDEVVGRPLWEAGIWPDDGQRDRVRRAIESAAGGEFVRYEVDVRSVGGSIETLDFSIKPMLDGSGRVALLIPEARVITEQKRAAEALRRSEAALKESQRLAGVGSWSWDPVLDVVVWSDELYRIAGRDPDRPPPNIANHAELLAGDGISRLDAAMRATLETGEPYEIELDLIGGDGAHRWVVARGEAVRGPDGKVAMLRGTAQDITVRMRFEEDLRRARDQAMAAMRAKGEFLANMSHEIRTPMNGVIGMTELLLDTPLDDAQRDFAKTIRTSGEALLTVIDDILDFSKIEAGKMTLEIGTFDLRDLLAEVANLLAPRGRHKGIEIGQTADPSIPNRLLGDPGRIRQILLNLAGNAVKFTDEGRVDLEARLVSESDAGARIRVLVRDTGIGIAEDHQASVFESFTQVEGGSSRKHGGTGLGLTICKSLVALMGGEIGLESRPGEGSTFWFELPLGKERRAERRPAPRHLIPPSLPAPLSILLAEDNEVNRRVAIGLAERLGCRVEAVRDGREAVETLDYGRHDLILMDVQMPGMDGFAATAAIREAEVGTGRRIPILAMTAHAMRGDRERCLAAGMDGYVAKPIRPGPLLDALLPWAGGPSADDRRAVPEIDQGILDEFAAGDPGILDEIFGLILDETPGRLASLAEALASEDGRRVYREAHALVGSFLAVGAEPAADACRDLMARGRIGDFTWSRVTFQTILDRWARIEADLLARRREAVIPSAPPA